MPFAHILTIKSLTTTFISSNNNIISVIGVYTVMDSIQNIIDGTSGVDSAAKLSFYSLHSDISSIENTLAPLLANSLNNFIAVLTPASIYAQAIHDAGAKLQADVTAPLRGVGLDLDPEQDRANQAMATLATAIAKCSGFTPIPTPLPTTFAALLNTSVSNVRPTTVQTLANDPAGQFVDILSGLQSAEAAVIAEWRVLQARANGWPIYLQRAALQVGSVNAALVQFGTGYGNLLEVRNKAAQTIDTPLLSLQARRSIFVQPAYGLFPPVDVANAPDTDDALARLEANDRLAEEEQLLTDIANYQPPSSGADTKIANFARFANSWRAADTQAAAPLQIAGQVGDLATEVLKGEVLSLIDISAFRDAILDAIARLLPTKAIFSYDFESEVVDEPDDSQIFQAALGTRFTLKTSIEADLLTGGDPKITTQGSLGPFAVKLVGDYVDAMTLHFGGVSFTSEGSSAPRFDVMYDAYDLGQDLAFFELLGPVLSPNSGSPVQVSPLQRTRGLDVGYDIDLGAIGIGEVSIFNINFAVSAELPFTDEQALFKVSLGTRLTPLTISFLPYAGSGYFSIYAGPDAIVGFEASFLFGAGEDAGKEW
jgi:hypothetical protein